MLFERKAFCLLTGFLYLITLHASAQDQRIADSLVKIYAADTLKGDAKLELLRNLSYNEMKDLNLGLKYAEELISLV